MNAIAWQRRPQALEAAGLVACGAAGARLLDKLGACTDVQPARLKVVATHDMLIVLGALADLPWVDGARYCAPEPGVPTLWLPTTMQPALPSDLLRRSAAKRVGDGPVLLWDSPEQFLPLHLARSLTPELRDWIAQCIA